VSGFRVIVDAAGGMRTEGAVCINPKPTPAGAVRVVARTDQTGGGRHLTSQQMPPERFGDVLRWYPDTLEVGVDDEGFLWRFSDGGRYARL
jgi:hypothetical protein